MWLVFIAIFASCTSSSLNRAFLALLHSVNGNETRVVQESGLVSDLGPAR